MLHYHQAQTARQIFPNTVICDGIGFVRRKKSALLKDGASDSLQSWMAASLLNLHKGNIITLFFLPTSPFSQIQSHICICTRAHRSGKVHIHFYDGI